MGYKTKNARFVSIEELAWKHVVEGLNSLTPPDLLHDTHFRRRLIRNFGRTETKKAIKKALEIRQMVCPPQTSGTITGRVVNFNPPMHQIRGVTATHVIMDEIHKLQEEVNEITGICWDRIPKS